jgi:hypothetical protein
VKSILFGNRGAVPYMVLLLASGTTLTLSMPWASRLSELMSYPWHPFPLPFFLVYGFFSAIVALDRSADAVPTGRMRLSGLGIAVARVAFAQALVLPLLSYSRVLFPGSGIPVLIAVAYVMDVSLCLSAGTVVLEIYSVRRGWNSSLLRYAAFFALLGAPAILLAAAEPVRLLSHLSPAVALTSIVVGPIESAPLALAFGVPTLLGLGFLGWIAALARGDSNDDEA